MTLLRLPPLALAALGSTLLAGCGGGRDASPERAAIRATLARFDRAQAGGDAKGTCHGLVAVEEQGRIEVPGEHERDAGEEATGAAGACERALAVASASRRALKDVQVEVRSVAVDGDRATARLRTRLTRSDGSRLDQPAVRRLVRVDGRWRILITGE